MHPSYLSPFREDFSVAGLTITKDQARLAPQTANEVIFLNNTLPDIGKYEESHAYN
jgi:hypothetical protein